MRILSDELNINPLLTFILQTKVDLHARDEGGRTALFFACRNAPEEQIISLLEAGANPTDKVIKQISLNQ